MNRTPEAWRRLVTICGIAGLVLVAIGFAALENAAPIYHAPARLAFYFGFGLLLLSIGCWYRYVPPRPQAPEGEEEGSDQREGN